MTVAGGCVPHQAVIGDSRQLATSATTCGVQPCQQPRFLMVRPVLGWAGLGCCNTLMLFFWCLPSRCGGGGGGGPTCRITPPHRRDGGGPLPGAAPGPLLGEVVLILLSCTPQAGPRDNLLQGGREVTCDQHRLEMKVVITCSLQPTGTPPYCISPPPAPGITNTVRW